MCGIAGIVDFGGGRVDDPLLQRMCAAMAHRGPDARGTYLSDGIGLGMQRLAIIDVAGGDQPIFNEDRSIAVVQNGEIYNYRELRERLVADGHRFASRSDTEVLVHLYEEHGERMVEHLRGMFAFAIWDENRRRLFLARDRVGKKPLFWARKGGRFWFASELRALLEDPEIDRGVDERAIAAYLALQYVPHPMCAFAAVRKLPPASTMLVTTDGERIDEYWSLDHTRKIDGSVDLLAERLREELLEATRIRMMSEVPLGAFLSGGVDSSAVVAAMAMQSGETVRTFSIGFSEQDFDELGYARLVADRYATDHHEFVVEPHALEIMPRLARHYGEPFADPSAIPSFYLAEMTGRHVTVALNGDGGDESFAGYRRYISDDKVRRLGWLPRPLQPVAALARFLPEGSHELHVLTKANRMGRIFSMNAAERYAMRIGLFDGARQRRLFTRDFAARVGAVRPDAFLLDAWHGARADDRIDVMLATDVRTYLPGDLLVKMDIATMAHSVEARSPFLDHHLMEFAASLPVEHKLARGEGKLLLKHAVRDWVPAAILERPKMGFGVPLAHWFRGELRDLPRDVLLDPRSLERGYFCPASIERLIRDHHEGRADHATRLWALLQLEFWHREVVEAPPLESATIEAARV